MADSTLAVATGEDPGVTSAHITSPCGLEMSLEKQNKKKRSASRGTRASGISKPRSPSSKCKTCCCRFTAFLFSPVGLCALVAGYSIVGAFAFRALESQYEENKGNQDQVSLLSKETANRIWRITERYNVMFKENWTRLVDAEVHRFQKDVISAVRDGKERVRKQWSFSRAFFYSLTVITTVGYGNIAPKTNWGKLVTILYAIFGIPLMFLYLTNIGNILAKTFKYVYGRLCSRRTAEAQRRRRQELEQYQIHHIMLQDAASPTIHNSIDSNLRNKLNASRDLDKQDRDDPTDDSDYTRPRVTVPITLCLAIIAGYICGGAAIFSVWEGWDYLDGSYFCFVTLSTIGFGDLVPGDSVVSDEGTQEKLVICSLYLLAGMALIAMCFNLVQEEVVYKIRSVGRSLGLISDQEDSDD